MMFGMMPRQLFIVVLGHICMVEVLLTATSFAQAFWGASLWSLIRGATFIRKNFLEAQRSVT
jgi:hypothetical protein